MKATPLFLFVTLLVLSILEQQTFAQAPDWQWAHTFGSAVQMYDERGESIAVDAAGNVYTVGEFTGTVDFDPGAGTTNFTTYGQFDVFISKLDAAGNFIWAKQLGGVSTDEAFGVTIDPTGNYIYVAGSFSGTSDFDPGPNTFNMTASSGMDIFISKFDISGNLSWAKQMEGSSNQYNFATGIVTDNFGNIYTTGYFYNTVDFDPGNGITNLTAAGMSSDVFISKLNASGNFIWAKQIGGTGDDRSQSICLDHSGNGNIFITGSFNNTADFDPGNGTLNLTSLGQLDVFVASYDASGNYVWARDIGGSSLEWGNEVALDVAGNVCITGGFYGTVDFDPGANIFNLTSAGLDDIFTVCLTSNGNFIRATSAGSTSWDEGMSIAADSIGNVYTTGFFSGTVDFSTDSATNYILSSIGDSDIFVSKMNASGNLVWATSAGGTKGETGLSIALNYSWDPYVSGYYRSSQVAFSNNTIDNADFGGSLVSDAFVAKLDHLTGIEYLPDLEGISIYPNPTTDQFTIHSPVPGNKIISIFNAVGEKIFFVSTLEEKTLLSKQGLQPGIYFVKVETACGNQVRKLIVE